MNKEIERLVVQMAKENPGWGYDRIVGAMANLGHRLSDQTVGNILRRHGLSPAPKRKQAISWKDFIRAHMEVLVGTDFFTVEVLTLKGLVTRERIAERAIPHARRADAHAEAEGTRADTGGVFQRLDQPFSATRK